jgi:type II secretory pathway component GspD/PulD (secretin)
MVDELARQNGYSVVFAENVDVSRKVTADFTKQPLDSVVRGMARMAGYAVALDKARRIYTIADRATYTFKLPPSLLQAVGSDYNVGTAGSGQGGTSGGATGGAGGANNTSSLGSTQQANFKVSGKSSPNSAQIQKLIVDQAGPGSVVSVTDIGIVTVKADALGLERAQRLIEQLARDAMTQVEVEAAVVEVSLQDDFQMGIDWSRVLTPKALGTGTLDLHIGGSSTPSSTSLSATFTSASVNSVISSLNQFTHVKVVSRPKVVSMNNIPSTFFAGNNIPYLGSVTTTTSTTTGTSNAAEVSFAASGVSLSVIPSVLSSKHVHLTLLPSLSKVTRFSEFDVGGIKLSAPDQSSRNAYMQVTAEDGKTVIIGGMKTTLDDRSKTGALGVVPTARGETGQATELVILLKTHIVPAPIIDTLIAESI